MPGYRSVVAAVDFHGNAQSVLDQMLRIGGWNRSAMRVVHVIDALVMVELEEAVAQYTKDIRANLVDDAKRLWADRVAAMPGAAAATLAAALDVRIGRASDGILQAAKEAKADLLVLGAHAPGDSNIGFGTVATACVRGAEGDVLLVREGQRGPFKRIVACVDFSETSALALERAVSLATQDGAALHVVHVFDAPWHRLHYRGPTPQAAPTFQVEYRELLARKLKGFAGEVGADLGFLKPEFVLFDAGTHRHGIPEYAKESGADLVVMGTRGKSNVRDVLLGSTAERTLRKAPCSVLAVRSPKADA
jgi:universal stress protein E